MRTPPILLTAIALSTATSLFAQTEVLTGVMRGKDYGVTYRLPKTEIVITVEITRHSYTPGELCRYADKYLRTGQVASESSTWWTMDAVSAKGVGVPDKSNTYFVKLKDKTTAPLMELTKEGVVRSINLPYSGEDAGAQVVVPTPTTEPQPDPRQYFTEEMLMVGSTAKLAELTAKEIYAIRESRNALVRGEADQMPTDGAQLKLMLDNLNEQENALKSLFVGQTTTETTTQTVRIVPREMTDKVAFRFSKELGMLDKDNLAGDPIYISLTDLKALDIPEPTEDGKELTGIAYNVPVKGQLTLTYGRQKLYDGEMLITQFGVTEYLAAVLFNKNATTQVLFDVDTGGLLKVDRAN